MDTFQPLGLTEPILKAISESGYETPTPIQLQAIPPVLAGKDVLGIAQTGTGKTAAFALPILQRLAADRKPTPHHGVRALILSPTRELASQIADSFRTYGKHLGFSVAVVFGGVSERPQSDKLRRGIDILVATPGRLLDHMGQRNVSLAATEIFVLDEADQMLDLGFFKPIRRIVADLPKVRQSLFFSATMPKEIEELTRELLTDPVKVAVTPQATTVERVTQRMIRIEQSKKKSLLAELLRDQAMQRTLVFTRTKRGADRVAKHLVGAGVVAAAIHGNKSQNQREAALHSFRTGRTRVLVATDIAARGIDIDEVSHVVNFEIPEVPEAYVHRIGRTARAGAAGAAISLCDEGERDLLRDIERLTRQPIDGTDRRNDPSLAADKPSSRGHRPTGEPRDGERPSQARREHKHEMQRFHGRGNDRGERSQRQERGPRPERGERRGGDRTGVQSRDRGERRDGGAPRPGRSFGDRPRHDREGDRVAAPVWTNDGSRPDREHRRTENREQLNERRGQPRPADDRRPPFRREDRAERRPDRDDRPPRRDERPHHARGERPRQAGERAGEPRHHDRRQQQAPGDRPRSDRERPRGDERPDRPERQHRDGQRADGRGQRPEGRREGRQPEGGRPSAGRPSAGRPSGGHRGERPRHEGQRSPAGGDGHMKRPSGQHREGGRPEVRKSGDRSASSQRRDDRRPPRRDADGA